MQLIEEGRVSLNDAARKYLPEIAHLQILDGFDAAREPLLRKPEHDLTIDQLMLHTAGFGCDFFGANLKKYRELGRIPSSLGATRAGVVDVLIHEPGERWTYGSSIEWLGLIVEVICGKRLGEVLAERVFAPLGMEDIGFTMTPSMRARPAAIHPRAADGQLPPPTGFGIAATARAWTRWCGGIWKCRRLHEIRPDDPQRRRRTLWTRPPAEDRSTACTELSRDAQECWLGDGECRL